MSKFTKQTLDDLLEEIVEEYFSEQTSEYGYGLQDVIETVMLRHSKKIETLED